MLAINFQGSSVLQFMPHSNTTLLGTKINTRAWGKYGANYTFTFNDENFVFVLVRSSKWLRNAKMFNAYKKMHQCCGFLKHFKVLHALR